MIVAEATLPSLRIALGSAGGVVFNPGLPVLAGDLVESMFADARRTRPVGRLHVLETDGWLVGGATVPLDDGLEAAAYELYRDILAAAGKLNLARIWNYVPDINGVGRDRMENYHRFCRGRAEAFEQRHGAGYKVYLPSASAVGCASRSLSVIFAATPAKPSHVENPLQVPAYDYPASYGPRTPSFARATVIAGPHERTVFVSGTAAIRGHATVAPNSTAEQLGCTLENMEAISIACGMGPSLGAGDCRARQFKVYLRHAVDQPAVVATLNDRLLRAEDSVSYLRADICRAELNVEIEATLRWPRSG